MALQHRGQESSGIVSGDGSALYRHVGSGLVASVYCEEDLEVLPGTIAIGHNRYSTSGGANDIHTQPVLKANSHFAFAHNGNLPITTSLMNFLSKHDRATRTLNDSGMMAEAIDCYIEEGHTLEQAIIKAYPLFTGVFSCVAMNDHQLIAFRDEYGIRPLSIGTLNGGYVVASETCAFDTIGAQFLCDVQPGELIVFDTEGIRSHQVRPSNLKLDIFEFVYFARPDSILEGQNVNTVRQRMGEELFRQYPINADIVVPVPDSAIPAALGYAVASNIPFEMALIKNRYIHRTFIRPTSQQREQDLRMKLNPIPELLKDKRVILIDDSIVRGTTTKKIVRLLKEAGAQKVHVLISSPPVLYPDFYGINLPRQEDLIAARLSIPEICSQVGADTLGYLSYDAMIRSTNLPASCLSMACFDGIYPAPIGEECSRRIRNMGAVETTRHPIRQHQS